MTLTELKERLAAIEHERWSHWQAYMHQFLEPGTTEETGSPALCLPRQRIDHWQRQIETPYEQLSEKEKQSDREEVERYWPLIEAYIMEKTVMVAEAEGVVQGKSEKTL